MDKREKQLRKYLGACATCGSFNTEKVEEIREQNFNKNEEWVKEDVYLCKDCSGKTSIYWKLNAIKGRDN